jgi:hypothetical protein
MFVYMKWGEFWKRNKLYEINSLFIFGVLLLSHFQKHIYRFFLRIQAQMHGINADRFLHVSNTRTFCLYTHSIPESIYHIFMKFDMKDYRCLQIKYMQYSGFIDQ